MDEARLEELLAGVAAGRISVEAARERLCTLPFEDLGYAKLDHHRALRTGVAEVVFCPGKTPGQVAELAARLVAASGRALCTRADAVQAAAVAAAVPATVYHERSGLIVCGGMAPPAPGRGEIAVLAAGTADLPVAEEAALTAEFLGNRVSRIYDVGVAGLHRLLSRLEAVRRARVVVVVAGMDGALPSVVAGLVQSPVVAVPTSVGYGASFGGVAALLTMLNSCSAGVGVVNIDNGFGAAVLADGINAVGRVPAAQAEEEGNSR